MTKHIPNLLTLLNLFSGCIAILCVFKGLLLWAGFWVGLGAIFDFLDGFVARLLKVNSPLGLQLDSLSDIITFGLVPSLMMYHTMLALAENTSLEILIYVAFLIVLGSSYRLAKFNIDETQTHYFKGLPTPANTIMVISLILSIYQNEFPFVTAILNDVVVLSIISVLSAVMMNINTPLFSLKFKSLSLQENLVRYIFLLCSVILIIAFHFLGLFLTIVLYLIVSVFMIKHTKKLS